MVTKIMVFPSGHPLGQKAYVKVTAPEENICLNILKATFGGHWGEGVTKTPEKELIGEGKSCIMEIHKIGEANAIIFPTAGVVAA